MRRTGDSTAQVCQTARTLEPCGLITAGTPCVALSLVYRPGGKVEQGIQVCMTAATRVPLCWHHGRSRCRATSIPRGISVSLSLLPVGVLRSDRHGEPVSERTARPTRHEGGTEDATSVKGFGIHRRRCGRPAIAPARIVAEVWPPRRPSKKECPRETGLLPTFPELLLTQSARPAPGSQCIPRRVKTRSLASFAEALLALLKSPRGDRGAPQAGRF